MTDFFNIYTETPWDNLKANQLTQIRVLSLKSVFKTYPVIEPSFFDDLNSKIINIFVVGNLPDLETVTKYEIPSCKYLD